MVKTLNMLPAPQEGATSALLNLNFGAPFAPQVQEYLRGLGDPRGFHQVYLVGQAVGAGMILPALEMLGGLPSFILYGMGGEATALGELDLADYRHQVVRPRRADLPRGGAFQGFTVLDGAGRGLTPVQKAELAAQLGCVEDAIRVFDIGMGQVDFSHPEKGMVEKVMATGLTFDDLTSGRVLHLPAGSGLVVAVMATTIYGLGESWPRCARLNKGADGEFHLAEILDCQNMRQFGTRLGGELEAAGAPVLVPRELLRQLLVAAHDGGATVEYDKGCRLLGESPRG